MASLEVVNLGKSYKSYKGRWGRLAHWFGIPNVIANERWVLRDLNFKLEPGEAVGIVGQNGAGKSTLLKLITGTSLPSEGGVDMRGRVSALLELGLGFHPELSGRENAFLSGSLLGISQQEMHNLMPSIESFAEIGDYIDQPVRVYSSGMQARLAFSVATAVRPDILIVDEVLSVGDTYFQHKSFERIREFKALGTTLLIVSHDRMAIQAICDRAVLLVKGELVKQGIPSEVMDYYHAMIAESEQSTIVEKVTESGFKQVLSGTKEASILSVDLFNKYMEPIQTVEVGEVLTLRVKVKVLANLPRLVLGYLIKDRLGIPVYGENTHHLNMPLINLTSGNEFEYIIKFEASLGVGSYSITLALTDSDTHMVENYDWREMAVMFKVTNHSKTPFVGCAWIHTEVEIKH